MNVQLIQKDRTPTFTQQQLAEYESSHYGEHYHQGDSGASSGGIVIGSDQHKNLWEHGQIEYVGRDSFSNIQAHLDSQLKK